MNYDCMVAEYVNRVSMVTTSLWYVRWHWRWERRGKGRHGITLALYWDECSSPKRMDNRLCSPECIYIHASFGIIPCMYHKKTVENSTFLNDCLLLPFALRDSPCRKTSPYIPS